MPGISNKARQMPFSPIRKLVPYAETAISKGKKVFFLNIGQPDIATPKNVLDKISNHNLDVIEYSHSAGFESYRKGLVKYYNGVGINLSHEQIIVTTGGSEALQFGFMSCFDPGDEVIIPEPFYANYNSFSIMAGVKVVPVTAKIENGFALPPIEEFEKRISLRTKGILICNPGNPTGYLYTKEELEKLRELVLKYNLFLFADEVYREFCYDGKQHHSIMNLEGLEQHAIMVDSVSKRYSMCGARVGALVTKNKYVLETVMKFAQARLSPPTLGQIAGEEALNTPQSYFDEVIEEYVERRNTLVDALHKIPGVKCPRPSGAFYVIAELPIDDADKFCEWILEYFEYNGKTVMMAPASGFYSMPQAGRNQVRLAYVLEKNHLKEAAEILGKALEVYKDAEMVTAKIPTL
ncbi:MAG: pyridoxal phosphate-dependent aminotransferase [Flavobacteriales bacterium]|nr:pyridoxal phosphate-dependent aminotransferase [Flavobacteriales bacterium]